MYMVCNSTHLLQRRHCCILLES